MSLDFDNPFADYGSIVQGKRFIGRRTSLQVLENRVIRPSEPGNLAIIGDHKIGKSSLVYKAIIERKDELIARGFLPIWVNLATYDQSPVFFRSLVTRCCDELQDLEWLTSPIEQAAKRALDDEMSWGEGYSRIQRFFEKVRQYQKRIIFILDEFDHARFLFKDNTAGFQGLRELSYRPEWRVTFVTTSRRTIRDIELQTQAISTFDGIFHKHYLGMFDDSALKEYFARLSLAGFPSEARIKSQIDSYCGGHPYLLETLGYEIVEALREQQHIDVDHIAQRIRGSFLDQYDRMTELLSEDGTLNKLLQILFGPVVDVQQTDVDELLRYGLIKASNRDIYVAYSTHFQTYLKLIERQTELWPSWREAELALRQLITAKMLNQYGEQWIAILEKKRPNLQPVFDKCRETQQKEEKAFAGRASRNLIDFTYPRDLFSIIFAEWDAFRSTLGRDKGYWDQRAQLLAKIRTPLAHNRDVVLHDYERQIAAGYCKEILMTLQK